MAKPCCPVTVHRQFTSGHLFADFQVPFERLSLQRLKPWVINLTAWNRVVEPVLQTKKTPNRMEMFIVNMDGFFVGAQRGLGVLKTIST